MDFGDLIGKGWARHESDMDAVLGELEAHAALADDAQKAANIVNLYSHMAGFHRADWARAAAYAERVIAGLPDSDALPIALAQLAVARFMAGDAVGALAAETRAVRLTESERVSPMLRTRVLIASALVENKRLEEGARLYEAALELARENPEKMACDRAIAVTSNNLAGALLEKSRTSAEDALMLSAATAAREFWLKAGTWENEERAEYLLAQVHNQLKQPEQAIEHALRGLEVISANGEEVVDEAFLNLVLAASFKQQGNEEAREKVLARADEIAGEWTDQSLKDWYAGERAKA